MGYVEMPVTLNLSKHRLVRDMGGEEIDFQLSPVGGSLK
jgi:hypothetical protein